MTLSEFSYYVRKFGPIAVVGFILFLIFYMVIQMIIGSITNRPVQQVYQPPFGQLPPVEFTHSVDYPPTFSMTIDNIEGRPITATSSANIYFTPAPRTRFGYQQTIGFMARAVGMDPEVNQYSINDLTATYNDGIRTLNIDIQTFNFDFNLDLTKVPTVFNETYIPDQNTIIEEAKSFLRQMNKFSPRMAQGSQNVIYLQYDSATDDFVVAADPLQANVVEVDFFQPDLGPFPLVSPKFYNSHNYVTMIFRQEGPLIINAQVHNLEPDFATGGVYPIKTGDEAWSELQNRLGTIVSPSKGSTDIIIRDMFLGYYDSDTYQPYLMPVYVFLGDNGFAAYVSAVSNEYIQAPESAQPTGATTQ